ncbi:hypothetical protein PPROV_000714700 [Pycnococcus provasolii]|uniref:TLDc domain-containing protein n=1 Tax=Pycnococcus provasolii TaxID=41880 RepID=A0A830HNB0_9CHLO|nr:hypothetical protein PPROV_000714700 [Pycnococcus provasolii]
MAIAHINSLTLLKPSAWCRPAAHTHGCRRHTPAQTRQGGSNLVSPYSRVCCRAENDGKGEVKMDPIEKLVSFFVGKEAVMEADKDPSGLQRLTGAALSEQYEAPTDVFADAVDGDDDEVALFRPLLAQTLLETAPLELVYCANKHGWNAKNFHARVDGRGGAVMLAETAKGALVGAYVPRGFEGYGDQRTAISAFLFRWPTRSAAKSGGAKSAEKLPTRGGGGMAVDDDASRGPVIGVESLVIPLADRAPKAAKSRLGSYFERRNDGTRTLFSEGEEKGTELKSFRVYTASAREEKTLDGIIWKTRVVEE